MNRFVVLAAVVAVAVVSANCANSREGSSSASLMAPSVVDVAAGTVTTAARGGGGKPGGGGTTGGGGTIALVMVTDKNNDGLPSFNEVVTFGVQTTATAYPWVTLKCYQNGTEVYKQSAGIFAISLNQNFQLGPTQLWTSGAANCTATLENWDSYSKNGNITTLASMSFSAN